MPTQELPPAYFVGGAPALDFLNSIASPVDVPVERLRSGEDFLNWLSQANLVKPEVLRPRAGQQVLGSLTPWQRKRAPSATGSARS